MATNFQSVMTGTPEQRVEALRQFLGYPLKQRDPEKNLFWYLRPGADEDAASETRPVAVGFYPELNDGSDSEIKAWVASKESAVSQHFFGWGDFTNQPVMYLLLPEAQQSGWVALVLPSESRQWRQRQVLTYEWDSQALLTPLGRLKQGELELMQKVEDKPMFSVPLVEWAFREPIKTAKELAQELAKVSRDMEQIIAGYKESTLNEYLRDLFNSFKRELLPNLKVSAENAKDYSFADIYAQTIAYGLFTARVFSHVRNPREDFNRQDAWDKLPETNPFLRQLFQGISEQPVESLGDDLADKISEVFSILRAAKMDAILSDFRQKMNREDIVIRFYEDFLAAYKPEMRERRGVYYTPEPVVSYMVRSVDILLKEKFDKPLGLADPEVMILDPACGTGTFLLWIFQEIHKRFEENPEAIRQRLEEFKQRPFPDLTWSEYVQEGVLDRIFGFELLMAPYAICHLKLGLFLEENGYQFDESNRLGVYLINTLEDIINSRKKDQLTLSLPQMEEMIAAESIEGQRIRNQEPVMVVIGNPPYSGHSENNNKWIRDLINQYKYIDGQKIAIRQGKWLQNDYVKFLRFAEWRIDRSGYGICCYITDNSYLDGETFVGMRHHLIDTFDEGYVLDLHGNINRGDKSPDGAKDENVFDISQGTAISIFLKHEKESKEIIDFHGQDLYGVRSNSNNTGKYDWLAMNSVNTYSWNIYEPYAPSFLFKNSENVSLRNENTEDEYNSFFGVDQIFSLSGKPAPGIVTTHDEFAISWTEEEVVEKVNLLLSSSSEEEARQNYKLCSQSQWIYDKAKRELANLNIKDVIIPIHYRPFDIRYTAYNKNVAVHLRERMSKHLFNQENVALITSRLTKGEQFNHVHVTSFVPEAICLSSKTSNNGFVFPLYIYSENEIRNLENPRSSNISKEIFDFLMMRLGEIPSEKSIFNYVYGILHSKNYRKRYSDLLRSGFPKVPFPQSKDLFYHISDCGKNLVSLHLLDISNSNALGFPFTCTEGDCTVDPGHPKYANGKVTINKRGAGFTGVPEEVWNFYIGGYQVCHKWLKDRKGRTLSDDDILHYQKIIVALQETIRIMQQIDEAIPSWPIE